jgi:hypothetical protein
MSCVGAALCGVGIGVGLYSAISYCRTKKDDDDGLSDDDEKHAPVKQKRHGQYYTGASQGYRPSWTFDARDYVRRRRARIL